MHVSKNAYFIMRRSRSSCLFIVQGRQYNELCWRRWGRASLRTVWNGKGSSMQTNNSFHSYQVAILESRCIYDMSCPDFFQMLVSIYACIYINWQSSAYKPEQLKRLQKSIFLNTLPNAWLSSEQSNDSTKYLFKQ